MLTLLLIFLITWLLLKLGVGVFKIFFFLLACGIIIAFFIHLVLPLIILAAIICLAFAII
ncbi:hypothetical protein [Lactobacillus sp. ESL0677]|uniref:hypothetical protein n=1 Tax=Lactobacillus sp. ESL0677 TaxID=2983208 RepID=UPI0023F9BB4D|nr:hypothetical protein [Lactobacillus sp. ESL0677]WEV37041.1 hypothetical protein OZX76_00170 [Lactobacillus sp. ESL0677]